ncbi:hypothetical protein Vadar_015938 [Vaccinium darrowii]|uniref:Uncharacterized protein n=1 Tax=Vaccinium darrowii TaxID=229202 RepID=A0ACB7YMH4_9ERIC|nr:hypothetical protein Vadar_015938 [Vaccinium darrowii]
MEIHLTSATLSIVLSRHGRKERNRRQDGRSSMGSGIFTAVMATTDMVMEGRVVVGDSETVAAGRMESDYGRAFWCCWCNLEGPTVVMRKNKQEIRKRTKLQTLLKVALNCISSCVPSHHSVVAESLKLSLSLLLVSQVYHIMKIESLASMIPFFDFSTLEKTSVNAVKNGFIAMKVDHMKGVVLFGNSLKIELSRRAHDRVLQEKNRLSRMVGARYDFCFIKGVAG